MALAALMLASAAIWFATAGLSYRLMRRTGWVGAWSFLIAAMILLGCRESVAAFELLMADKQFDVMPPLLSFLAACLTLAGIALMTRKLLGRHGGNAQKFRDLVEGSLQGVFVLNAEWRVLFANKAVARIFGFDTPDEMLALDTVAPLVAPEDITRLEAYRNLRLQGERPPEVYEYEGRRIDGTPIYLENRSRHVIWDDQPAVQCTVIDITERKQAEIALNASRERLRQIAQLSTDWIWETDSAHCYTYMSARVTEVSGLKPEVFLGKSRVDVLNKAMHSEEVRQHLVDLAHHRPFQDVAYWADLPAGQRCLSVSGRPLFDENGDFAGYRGTGRDITNERRAQMALIDAKEEAQAASKAKSDFLAHMSHEFRTPLNAILGFSDVIRGQLFGPIDETKYLEYGNDIYESGEHLLSMINDILDLSKIEAGQWELFDEEIDVGATLAAVVRLVDDRAARGGVVLAVEAADDLPRLWADERALKQVLLNLLSNAVKFTDADGHVTLSVAIEANGDYLFRVADQGIGIPADELGRVLEPFEQASNSLTRQSEGTGLGLPLAKSFVELQGGTLEIESEVGAGTLVSVRFPASRVRDVDGEVPTEVTPPVESAA